MTNEQLVARIQAGENTAENMLQLWQQTKAFVAKLAKKYKGYAEFDDLMQEGYLGLNEAVNHYDVSQHIPFINYAAYFAEIYRSGIESIPNGQYEAAQVLGYNKAQTFIRIILPQVIKRVLPSITNETITLVKDTSLAFTISIAEMFTVAKQIGAAQTSVMPLLAAGIFYYVFNLIVATVMEYIEKRLSYYR